MRYALVNGYVLDGRLDGQVSGALGQLAEGAADGASFAQEGGTPGCALGSVEGAAPGSTPGCAPDGLKTMTPRAGLAVVVADGRFEAIVPQDELAVRYPDIELVDLGGGYLAPGLINLHAHIVISGGVPKSEKPTDYRKLVQTLKKFRLVKRYFIHSESNNVEAELLSGVTTVRSVGGVDDYDGIVRDRVAAGKVRGARVISANAAVSVPGGHFAGSLATEATTPEEAVSDVRRIAQTRPDLIKLMITGGVMDASEEGEPGALRMPPELVRAACDEAHRLGYQVAAHVESPEGVRVALENGVDTIEHGAQPDDRIMELFRERGAADVCTISPALPYVKLPLEVSRCGEMARRNGTVVMDGIIECARRCLAEGVPVGLGNDVGCPFITHYDFWRELVYFVHYCGVTPAFALHTATLVNAQILRMEDEIGSIEPGKRADFIVADGNPLDDLSRLRTLRMVAKDGEIVRDPQPRRDPAVEAALDTVLPRG